MKMIYFQAFAIAFVVFIFVIVAYQTGRGDGRREVLTRWENSLGRTEK